MIARRCTAWQVVLVALLLVAVVACEAPATTAPTTPAASQADDTMPKISLDSSTLAFTFTEGDTKTQTKILYLMNDGGGVLIYATRKSVDWMWLNEPDGACEKGYSKKIEIFVSGSGLAAGTYKDNLVVSAQRASNTPQTVQVTVTVNPAPVSGQEAGIDKKPVPPPPWEYNEYKNDNYNFVIKYPKDYQAAQTPMVGTVFSAITSQATASSNDIIVAIKPRYDFKSSAEEWAKEILRLKGAKANLKVISQEDTKLADGVTPASEILYETKVLSTQSYKIYIRGVNKKNRWVFFGGISVLSDPVDHLPVWKQIADTLEFPDQ
ncbi:MAG: hypothetical protein PHO26_02010 [Dehalococcoidia bacterium]|nr:hypothetical protein [Dehalococcoidia bacterium]MDD5494935.1 hypothetical protein [Dehalococcoidia bacterium]